MPKNKPKPTRCAGYARGCARNARPGQLMCPDCWALVPEDIQKEVNRTYAKRNREALDREHAAAMFKAIRSLPKRKYTIGPSDEVQRIT